MALEDFPYLLQVFIFFSNILPSIIMCLEREASSFSLTYHVNLKS